MNEESEAGRAGLTDGLGPCMSFLLTLSPASVPHYCASICKGPLSSCAGHGLEGGAWVPGGHSFRLLTLHSVRRDVAVEGPDIVV